MEILVGQVACLEFNFFMATFGEDHLPSQCDQITALKFGNYSRCMKCCQHLKLLQIVGMSAHLSALG